MAPIEAQLYINGELAPSSDNATFDLFSPCNKELVARSRLSVSWQQGGSLEIPDKSRYETVKRYIEEGKKTGEAVCLDAPMPGENGDFFVTPVIFVQQPGDAKVMREEIFGPVVSINKFETDEEALKMANDTEHGLYASVYTKDINRALRFAQGFESGMVGVNCTSPTGSLDVCYSVGPNNPG